MTIAEFRANEEATKWWQRTYSSKGFQTLLETLNESHPMRFTDDKTRFSNDAASHRLGMVEGYQLVLERLRLCAQYEAMTGQLPDATFQPIMSKE